MTPRRDPSPRTPLGAHVAVLSCAVLSIAASCRDSAATPSAVPAPPARPVLRLLVVTDLQGTLEPCGCTSRQLGGLGRMAARVRELRADGIATTLIVAGDTFVGPGDASDGSPADGLAQQQAWRADTVAAALRLMDAQLVIPGSRDLALGSERIAALLHAASDRALLPGNLAAGAGALGAPARARLGVGALAVDVRAVQELPAGSAVTAAPGGADLSIGVAVGGRRFARQAAARLDAAAFVVQTGLDEAEPSAPIATDGGPFLLSASRHGRGILVVDVYGDLGATARLTDRSEWTRRAARRALETRVTELRTRIEAWASEPNTSPTDLADQRARLLALEAELAGSHERGAARAALWFEARFVELPSTAPEDPSVVALMREYDVRVNAHNRSVFASLAPRAGEPGAATYTGSTACGECHAEALTWWRAQAHGRAYATLSARAKEYNLECVSCHVTAYGKPGGSNVTHNLGGELTNVGCESCHGPGSQHAREPERARVVLDAAEVVCLQCHTPEHSDAFEYASYRARLLAPGHGAPAPVASSGAAPREGVR